MLEAKAFLSAAPLRAAPQLLITKAEGLNMKLLSAQEQPSLNIFSAFVKQPGEKRSSLWKAGVYGLGVSIL